MPWPVGVVLGLLVLAAGKLLPAIVIASSNPYLSAIGKQLADGTLDPLVWLVAILFWIAAVASFVGRARRRHLLGSQSDVNTLRALSWRDFERLVGEAFRRHGYLVEESGLGGADGGVDLLLRKNEQLTLVQCKHWKTQRVGVSVVREQFGLLAHHRARESIVVTAGRFTAEAQAFARGKPIWLIDGPELVELVRSVQGNAMTKMVARGDLTGSQSEPAPNIACPRCGETMVRRTARANGSEFLGCSGFPRCRGVRQLQPDGGESAR
jgi:restriction system protein